MTTTIEQAKEQILNSDYFEDFEKIAATFKEHPSLQMDGAFFIELMQEKGFRYLNFADDSMYSNPKVMLTAYEYNPSEAEIIDEYLPDYLRNDEGFRGEVFEAIERGFQREEENERSANQIQMEW